MGTVSSCDIRVNGSGVGSRICSISANELYTNGIEVSLSNSASLGVGAVLSITIGNVKNPSTPDPLSDFSLYTFEDSSDEESMVEYGHNITTISYQSRTVYPSI